MKRRGKTPRPDLGTVTQEQVKLLALVEQGGVHRGATSWYLEHRPAKQWDAEALEVLRLRGWISWVKPDRAIDHGMAAPVDITPEGRVALRHHLPDWVLGRRAIAASPPRLPAVETIGVFDALR
ncbi:hypothetical protein AB0A63_30750 [Lentzea sp. NPDC042327]|uniref:hypothetical protein n=1 Tax=Lentzea sp. NPDC042327 TaxID=3154801 RepID=UPI0033C3B590